LIGLACSGLGAVRRWRKWVALGRPTAGANAFFNQTILNLDAEAETGHLFITWETKEALKLGTAPTTVWSHRLSSVIRLPISI
jgi:hypothetical protein